MNGTVKECIDDYKKKDNVDSVILAAVLKIYKIYYITTGMMDIKADVYLASDFSEETFTFKEHLHLKNIYLERLHQKLVS